MATVKAVNTGSAFEKHSPHVPAGVLRDTYAVLHERVDLAGRLYRSNYLAQSS